MFIIVILLTVFLGLNTIHKILKSYKNDGDSYQWILTVFSLKQWLLMTFISFFNFSFLLLQTASPILSALQKQISAYFAVPFLLFPFFLIFISYLTHKSKQKLMKGKYDTLQTSKIFDFLLELKKNKKQVGKEEEKDYFFYKIKEHIYVGIPNGDYLKIFLNLKDGWVEAEFKETGAMLVFTLNGEKQEQFISYPQLEERKYLFIKDAIRQSVEVISSFEKKELTEEQKDQFFDALREEMIITEVGEKFEGLENVDPQLVKELKEGILTKEKLRR